MKEGGRKYGVAASARRGLMAAAMLALLAAPSASAQGATSSASCVGGAIGCDQVDFTFTVSNPPATVNFFRIALTGGGGTFTPVQASEAEDALGVNFFVSQVSDGGRTLFGSFPFGAELNPWLRVRTQFQPGSVSGAGALSYRFELGSNGQTAFSGSVTAVNAVPEPSTIVLMATGLLAVGASAARRRRGARGTTA